MRSSHAPRTVLEEYASSQLDDVPDLADGQLLLLGHRERFPEVPRQELDPENWRCAAARRWRRAEHITALKAEAYVWAARCITQSAAAHFQRHVILSDVMAWVLAATKGRSSRPAMLSRCWE